MKYNPNIWPKPYSIEVWIERIGEIELKNKYRIIVCLYVIIYKIALFLLYCKKRK
jgi:hypothetical protein